MHQKFLTMDDIHPGQIVEVLKVDAKKNRLLLSNKKSFVTTSLCVPVSYEDLSADTQLLEAEVVVKRGNNVEVKLQPSGVKALLPKHHLADSADNQELLWRSLEVGKAVGTVMLYKQTDSVPGQLLPGVVKNHQTYGIFVELPGGLSGLVPRKARVGQRIKAEVVLVKEDFVLVALKQHAAGILAYVPTKQHVNDVLVKDLPSVGEQTHVIIQRSDAGRVLANLEVRVPEAMMRKGKLVHARHELQLGQLVTAQ
nr:hypothetical protein BaRGS_018383 [Batillaria attramentaria]